MSEDWRSLCAFSHEPRAPANYDENVGRARLLPPHAADNAAQGPCSEAESHGADDQRPLGKGHSRHRCKSRLSDVQELELSFFLNAIFFFLGGFHPIPWMRQKPSLRHGRVSSVPLLQGGC